MQQQIKLVSLNCTGLGEVNRRLLHDFLDCYSPDILLLQETWLLQQDLCRLGELHDLYMGRGKTSVPNDAVLLGRPYGGLGVLWKKTLTSNLKFLDCSHERLQPFVLTLGNAKQVLICNVYFPNDNRSTTTVSEDFYSVIDALEICMQDNILDFTVIGGDFNTDFIRNNAQSNYLEQFLLRNSLSHTWQDYIYTFSGPNSSKSCIDYFMVDCVLRQLSHTEVLDYTSWPKVFGHSPIAIDIKCDINNFTDSNIDFNSKFESPAWHKIKSFNSYQTLMDNLLDSYDFSTVRDCLQCHVMQCKDIHHQEQINNFCKHLTNICITASKRTLPHVRRKKGLPGWNVKVKPLRDDAHFWGNLWKQCGRPDHGVVLDIYRKCRKEYHSAVRSIRQQEAQSRREEMAKHIAENNSRDLWKELNKLKPKSRITVPNIDGKNDQREICNIFYEKTKTLFNSVPSSLDVIKGKVEEGVQGCNSCDSSVTSKEVRFALSHLKEQKSDGHKGLWSTLIIHSSPKWQECLAQLITAMLTHGYYAEELLLSTVLFLPKDVNKNVCSSENYRGISLYSSVNKVIEWIILNKYTKCFVTSDLQFSYKKKHSTTMCTAVLKEIVSYYFQRHGEVSCVLLDASKAFDRVKLDILFEILMKRSVPFPIIRLLLDMYSRQLVRTSWGDSFSQCFSVTNGVRQGGVISPILFTLYIDELLLSLESQGLGCFVGHQYFGALCYADDVTLLAPTGYMLQRMLHVCEKFGCEFSLNFNVLKTVCIKFTKSKTSVPPVWVKFGSQQLHWVSSVKHLGNVLCDDLKEREEIRAKQSDFIGKTNSVIANFRTVQREICSRLFNAQCCSFYGCEAWKLSDPNVNGFFVTWRKAVRRLWNLPNTTRSALLPDLMNCRSAQHQIYQRSQGMYSTMLASDNDKIRFISNLSVVNLGFIGSNLQFLQGQDMDCQMSEAEKDRVKIIKELSNCKERSLSLPQFTDNEIDLMLKIVSTF